MRHDLPWSGLPAALAGELRESLPAVVEATILAISHEVPAYRGALDRAMGPTVRRGVEVALNRMLDLFGTDDPALDPSALTLYERIGAGEYQQGRSLDALLAAYRTGARVSWERMSAASLDKDVPPAILVTLAESIFVYIDELSGASAQGHARAAAAGSGHREVLRSQLARAIVDGEMRTSPVRVTALADRAEWSIPEELVVAVVSKRADGVGPPFPLAPPDVLVIDRGEDAVAVIPDPTGPGRANSLRRTVTGQAFVGTVVPATEAPMSLRHALGLRSLAESGVLPADRVLFAANHLPELLLAADPEVVHQIRERALRGLADLSDAKREVLERTLAAWLDHQGDRAAVAAELVVHPQTVSYRMGRLRSLLGSALESPRGRLMLRLALPMPDDPN